eukprot:2525195-Rhodomonas_salina.2
MCIRDSFASRAPRPCEGPSAEGGLSSAVVKRGLGPYRTARSECVGTARSECVGTARSECVGRKG